MNGVFWWSAESCLLPLHLFTSLFFKSSLRDTLPPLAQTQSPHPLNLTHQPPPSHLLLKRTPHLPNTHTYIPATPSLPPPVSHPMSFPIQFHPAFFSPSSVLDLCPNWFEAYSLTQMHAKFDSLHSVVLLSSRAHSLPTTQFSLYPSTSHGVTNTKRCPREGCLSMRKWPVAEDSFFKL